jgi:hypothetical protein
MGNKASNNIHKKNVEVPKTNHSEQTEEGHRYYIPEMQYDKIPTIPESERVSVDYPIIKDFNESISHYFYTTVTSYYKWHANSMFMSDINIITQHKDTANDNEIQIRTGLIDKLNNYILAYYVTDNTTKHKKLSKDPRLYDKDNYMMFGLEYQPLSCYFRIQNGLIGRGMTIESVQRPGEYVRLIGKSIMLTRRRLQFGETVQEFNNSATFSLEKNSTLKNALTRGSITYGSISLSVTNAYTYSPSPISFVFHQTEVALHCRYLADRIYLCSERGVITNDNGKVCILGESENGLLTVHYTTTDCVEFESVTSRGSFLSYSKTRQAFAFCEKDNSMETEFKVTRGYMGKDSYCFELKNGNLLYSFGYILVEHERDARYSDSRNLTSFTVKRIPE